MVVIDLINLDFWVHISDLNINCFIYQYLVYCFIHLLTFFLLIYIAIRPIIMNLIYSKSITKNKNAIRIDRMHQHIPENSQNPKIVTL